MSNKTNYEKLHISLVWHDYAMRYMMDAVGALLEATDFDATPAERHKARGTAARDIVTAHRALEQAQLVQTIGDDAE